MPDYAKLLRKAIGDGARSNKYNVVFNINGSSDFQKRLSATCKSCGSPGAKAKTMDFKYKGFTIPLPLNSETNHDWDADFYLDENHDIKKFFDDWILAYGARGQYTSANGEDFVKTIKIPNGTISFNDPYMTVDVDLYQFDFNANIMPDTVSGWTAHYVLHNVFPISTTDPQYSDQDEMMTVKVQFKYSYFESKPGGSR